MNGKELRRSVIKQLFLICLLLIVQMTIFFISAGHIGLLRPWIFFGASFAQYIVGTVVQYKLNPELLVQRLKIKREGSKRWDEILVRVSNLMLLIAVPVIAGLDVGRFQWSYLEVQFAVLGFVFFMSFYSSLSVFSFSPLFLFSQARSCCQIFEIGAALLKPPPRRSLVRQRPFTSFNTACWCNCQKDCCF